MSTDAPRSDSSWKNTPRHGSDSEFAGIPISKPGDPVWELASLYPHQGEWTEEAYLDLQCKRGIEFVDGVLEFLPMPTEFHQILAAFFFDLLRSTVGDRGLVLFSGLRVRIRPEKVREPDVVLMLHENRSRRSERAWKGADLAVEIVSEDDPKRDYETKREDYAEAGIREYWIVDPRDESVTLLVLEQGQEKYTLVGRFEKNQICESRMFVNLRLTPAEIFNRPERLRDKCQ